MYLTDEIKAKRQKSRPLISYYVYIIYDVVYDYA